MTAAYDGMGIVTDEDGSVFWSRVDRADMITIRNPESLVLDLERYLKGFEEGVRRPQTAARSSTQEAFR